eukprot:623513-Prymnesium_polylepis.1
MGVMRLGLRGGGKSRKKTAANIVIRPQAAARFPQVPPEFEIDHKAAWGHIMAATEAAANDPDVALAYYRARDAGTGTGAGAGADGHQMEKSTDEGMQLQQETPEWLTAATRRHERAMQAVGVARMRLEQEKLVQLAEAEAAVLSAQGRVKRCDAEVRDAVLETERMNGAMLECEERMAAAVAQRSELECFLADDNDSPQQPIQAEWRLRSEARDWAQRRLVHARALAEQAYDNLERWQLLRQSAGPKEESASCALEAAEREASSAEAALDEAMEFSVMQSPGNAAMA